MCFLSSSTGKRAFELMVIFVLGMVISFLNELLINRSKGLDVCGFHFLLPRFVPSIPPSPAAADTISRFLEASKTAVDDYDMVFTGDLGRVGSRLLRDLLAERGIDLGERHSDCGMMIFDESQDVHAGGSGCGCCASVLCGYILDKMREGVYRNILFVPTGALLSPTTVMQKQSIPSIAHLVQIKAG